MATKKKHTPKRAGDQSTLTISLPKDLKARIESAAKKDNRSTSNYLVTELLKLLGLLAAAFCLFHLTRTPKAWNAAALKATASAAWGHVQKFAR